MQLGLLARSQACRNGHILRLVQYDFGLRKISCLALYLALFLFYFFREGWTHFMKGLASESRLAIVVQDSTYRKCWGRPPINLEFFGSNYSIISKPTIPLYLPLHPYLHSNPLFTSCSGFHPSALHARGTVEQQFLIGSDRDPRGVQVRIGPSTYQLEFPTLDFITKMQINKLSLVSLCIVYYSTPLKK